MCILSHLVSSRSTQLVALTLLLTLKCLHFLPSSLNYPFHLIFLSTTSSVCAEILSSPLRLRSLPPCFSAPAYRLQHSSSVLLLGGLCQRTTATVLIYPCSQSPEESFCRRDPCIIVHQLHTKLMTRGYVGQARMMQQTCTEGP